MSNKKLLALMYDFYNKHTLKGQNDDINYYINQIKQYGAKNILVVGAGTGRVAVPLSAYAHVTALDLNEERLKLLRKKTQSNIKIIGMNFLEYIPNENFDLVILPYSTLQFESTEDNLNIMLKKIYNVSTDNTITLFDISESFNTKEEQTKRLLFTEYCDEVKDEVSVFYSSKRDEKFISFVIEYYLNGVKKSIIEKEKYFYYDRDLIKQIIDQNNLRILKIDSGYGKPGFDHKHIYHVRRI